MNGGGSSASFVSRAVRKLTASSTRQASLDACEVDDRRDGGQVGVVEQDRAADADVRGDVPPVEDRVREPVRAVDEHEVERARLPPREDLVRGADAERDGAGVDAELGAAAPDALLLARVGSHGLVDGARGGEHDRARAGAGLERRPSGSTLRSSHSSAAQASPQYSPVAVQARRRGAQRVGDRRRRHRGILRETRCRGDGRRRVDSAARMATPRAFITGVGGQDGSLLAALLLEQGYEVVGVVRRDPSAYAEALATARGRVELVEADLLDHGCARRGAARDAAHRGLQPRGAVVRPALVGRADPDRRVRGGRRDVDARGDPRGRPGDPLLPGVVERDLRRAARDAADGGDAAEPAHAVRRREGLRPLHRRQLPPRYGMFTCCGILYNHESPLRPVDFLPRKVVARGRGDLAGPRGRARRSATSPPAATGATPATTCARCG